ncbi:MAG: SusD/RagB family nutrient-binding outer membrane lipoprotein, partial [Sphingobacteriales bacterium]
MKKTFFYILMPVMSISLFTGCTKDFEDINTDPNRIESISPGTLLNPIIFNMASFNTTKSDDITFNLMQVMLPYPSVSGGVHRYDLSETAGNSTWTTSYRWLTNVREMYNASVNAQDNNYKAIAMTLNAWIYSNLTDAFGDVPKAEATRGEEGIFQPAFDSQQTIYSQLLLDLDSANTMYNTAAPMPFGTEILYANNISNWRRFTNSLKMRLLLRVSKKAEMNSWAELRKMIDAPTTYPVFTANDQAAVLKITGVFPNVSPWGRA